MSEPGQDLEGSANALLLNSSMGNHDDDDIPELNEEGLQELAADPNAAQDDDSESVSQVHFILSIFLIYAN